MNKELTTEELARIVSKGFDDMATKQEVRDGFSKVEATLNRIENRLTHVDDTLIADFAVRIKRLEEAVATSRR